MPTLLRRIALRGRDFERAISAEYLKQLNALYDEWIGRFALCPGLTVPADAFDFVRNNRHLELIIAKIWKKLQGKETIVFGQVARS